MKDIPAPTDMEARWQRWAAQSRAWGPPGNDRLAVRPLLHEQPAVPACRAASAVPAADRAGAGRIDADAVRKRRRPDRRRARRRTAAPAARDQLRGLGRAGRDPYPRLPDPG